jgi:hypothetical protein
MPGGTRLFINASDTSRCGRRSLVADDAAGEAGLNPNTRVITNDQRGQRVVAL